MSLGSVFSFSMTPYVNLFSSFASFTGSILYKSSRFSKIDPPSRPGTLVIRPSLLANMPAKSSRVDRDGV